MSGAIRGVVESLLYGGVVAAVGYGAHRGFASGSTRKARRIVVGLVVAAVTFTVGVVIADAINGTGTSTESFIIFIASIPLLLATAIVVSVDKFLRDPTKRPSR